MFRYQYLIALVCAYTTAFTGCTATGGGSSYEPSSKGSSGWSQSPENIETLAAGEANTPELQDFPDVLVPTGFVFDPRQSYVNIAYSESGTKYRVAQFFYTGKANVPSVANFYRDQMATNGWKLDNMMGLFRKTLDFSKAEQQRASKLRVILIPNGRKTEAIIHVF